MCIRFVFRQNIGYDDKIVIMDEDIRESHPTENSIAGVPCFLVSIANLLLLR